MMLRHRLHLLCLLAIVSAPTSASGAWQTVSSEPGKRVEIDRGSIRKDDGGKTLALGRVVLDKPIVDAKTAGNYRIVQALNRYDCQTRTYSTVKRGYYKAEGELLREEEVRVQIETPIRSGMIDDKLLREVCRPKPGPEAGAAASRTVDKVNEAASELRKANEALIQKEIKRANMQTPVTEKSVAVEKSTPASKPTAPVVSVVPTPVEEAAPHTPVTARRPPPAARKRSSPARTHARVNPPANPVTATRQSPEKPLVTSPAEIHWAYDGAAGPEQWGHLKADYATCATGRRQSPIDIRDGLPVDLEPIQFTYRPSPFRVIDNGHTIQVNVDGSRITLLGTSYELIEFHFHRPAEERVNGQTFDMVAHLVHRSEDGKLAVVAVLLEKGSEHPLIQTIWNHLPLEKNEYVTPPEAQIDIAQLLPADRRYYTYMGSLTTPPCTEGVLWLVLKQPQQLSPEQLAIFSRLYRHNVRPIQPMFSRLIKESR